MSEDITRASQQEVVLLSVLAVYLFLAYCFLCYVGYRSSFRRNLLHSLVVTKAWFPQCIKHSLRRFNTTVNIYLGAIYCVALSWYPLSVFFIYEIVFVFKEIGRRYQMAIWMSLVLLYLMTIVQFIVVWKSNLWSIVPMLYPQHQAASLWRSPEIYNHHQGLSIMPERRIRRILIALAVFIILVLSIANLLVVFPVAASDSVDFAVDIAGAWAFTTVNTVLITCGLYFADCFLHSAADILVEIQAEAAESNMRYGILSSLTVEKSPEEEAQPKRKDGKLVYMRALSTKQRKTLEKNIYTSSHNLHKTMQDAAVRQKRKRRRKRKGAYTVAENAKPVVIDEIIFDYCGKMAAYFLIFYTLSFVVLLLYGTVYFITSGLVTGFTEIIGIIMADTILFVKFSRSSYRLFYSKASSFPVIVGGLDTWQICLILVLLRTALVSVPLELWFVGQCLMYLVAGIYLAKLCLDLYFKEGSNYVQKNTSSGSLRPEKSPDSIASIYTYGFNYLREWYKPRLKKQGSLSFKYSEEEKPSKCVKPTIGVIALLFFTLYIGVLTIIVWLHGDSLPFPKEQPLRVLEDTIAQWKLGVCSLLLVFNYAFARSMLLMWRWNKKETDARERRKGLGFSRVNISGAGRTRSTCNVTLTLVVASLLTVAVAAATAWWFRVFLLPQSNLPLIGMVITLYPLGGFIVYLHYRWTSHDFVFVQPQPVSVNELVAKERSRGQSLSPHQVDRWKHRWDLNNKKRRLRNASNIVLLFCIVLLISTFGFVLSYAGFRPVTSALLPTGIVSIASGLLSAELWFNTYRVTPTFIVLVIVFAVSSLCSFTMAGVVLVDECCLLNTLQVIAVFLGLFPAILLQIVGLLFLEDNEYEPTAFSVSALSISTTVFIAVGAWLMSSSGERVSNLGIGYLCSYVIFMAATFLFFLWRSNKRLPSPSKPFKAILIAVCMIPSIVLWCVAAVEEFSSSERVYWLATLGFLLMLILAITYLVVRLKLLTRSSKVYSPAPVPFGFPLVTYNIEHRGGELVTSNFETLFVLGIIFIVQLYGFYTSSTISYNAGAAISNISLCLLVNTGLFLMVKRFSKFRQNLSKLEQKVGLEKAFEVSQKEAVERCLQISQQAMMGVWLKSPSSSLLASTANTDAPGAEENGYHTGKSLIKKDGFRYKSWEAAVTAMNNNEHAHEVAEPSKVVMRTVDDFVHFHEDILKDQVEYEHYCRDSVNYRSLFHIIFVLVMKQMLTEENERPALAEVSTDESRHHQQSSNLTDVDIEDSARFENPQLAFDTVLTNVVPREEGKTVVYPWGTGKLMKGNSSNLTLQKRQVAIQEKLSLKRHALARPETSPAKLQPMSFNFSFTGTSTACASNSTVRKLLLFAEYQKEKTGQSWSDPDFPASNGSLFLDWDDDDEFLQEAGAAEDLTGALWCRPHEMLPQACPGYTICSTKGSPFDPREVIQGNVGDCWLLSAISVVALFPELIGRVVVSTEINNAGIYQIRLFLNGSWTNVVVDDLLPCYVDRSLEIRTPLQACRNLKVAERPPQKTMVKLAKNTNAMYLPMPQYCRSRSGTVLWAMLIEKAFAKHLGCYEALEGGHVHNALVDLTGGFSQVYSLRDDVELVASGALWNKLVEYSRKDALLAAGSPGQGEASENRTLVKDECGIVQGHAYSILRVVEEHDINGTHRLLQLRDPWGETEWSGAWCKHDRKRWTKRMQKRLNFRTDSHRYMTSFVSHSSFKHRQDDPKDDREKGSFWISLVDFTKHLKWLYVCQLFNPNEWEHKSVRGEWIGCRAGGPPNQPGAKFNPQFTLKFAKKDHNPNLSLFVSITNLTSEQEMELDSLESDSDGDDISRSSSMPHRKILNAKRTYPYMSLLLLDLDGKPLEDSLVTSQVVASTGKYKNTRELSLDAKLPNNSDKVYTLFPSLYPSGQEGRFLINVYCCAQFELKEIPFQV